MARRAENYILSITAGPTYQDQRPIPINTPERTPSTGPRRSASRAHRNQNNRGLPANSPSTSPYFSHAPHTSDLYSLEFSFTLKNEDINGNDLVFGNDFDHPIRDKLPPGFNQAFNLVKWFVDPGLYGDVYAEEPYLYGPLLSSMNVLRVGAMDDRMQERVEEVRKDRGEGESLVEGGEGDGVEERERLGVPGDAAGRKKWFLTKGRLEEFTFEKGREYENDFFNPYLDFNEFSLKLPGWGLIPGITMPIISYWDGQPLRYVMKKRDDDEPLLVIVFTLVPKIQTKGNDTETPAPAPATEEKKSEDDDLD